MPYWVKMVRKAMQLVALETYADANHGLRHATTFDSVIREYERELEEDNEVDEDYKNFLLDILAKEKTAESNKKRREIDEEHDDDCSHEEEIDPQYEIFLKSLKEHEKSYIVEGEKNGLPVIIRYEGDSSSDKECDVETRRKLGSAMKQSSGPSDQMLSLENQGNHDSPSTPTKETKKLIWTRSRNKSNSEKEENIKLSTNNIVPDPDYLAFMSTLKVVGHNYVYEYGGHRVVYDYELKDGEDNHEKEDRSDGSFSDVEILASTFFKEGKLNFSMVAVKDEDKNYEGEEHNDGSFSDVEILESTFYKQGTLNFSKMNKGSILDDEDTIMQSEFRHKVIAVLRKPYNEEEYEKLWQDIELRKPEERHMELRNGRERSYSIEKDGKSYLDHHPELERKLLQVLDDKPKCLNLLRMFFVWLQQPGMFYPWDDAECLAIYPGSS